MLSPRLSCWVGQGGVLPLRWDRGGLLLEQGQAPAGWDGDVLMVTEKIAPTLTFEGSGILSLPCFFSFINLSYVRISLLEDFIVL